jgi:3-oxoacyl-[acyl-carrier-protein] synthase-3
MSNEELSQIVDTSDEWIFSHTGIKFRHIAAPEQAASDLAVEAAREALTRANMSPAEVEFILVATSTPDFPGLPSTASVVQDRLDCPRAAAMDIVAACTGFIYGLETARAFIRSGTAANVLVIGSEVYSKIINWEDRNSCVLFGDGAGAAVVTAAEDDESYIIDSYLRSQGSGAESLYRCAGGSRTPFAAGETERKDLYLSMDGRRVYVFAVQAIVDTIQLLLDRNRISIDDVDWVVPHQANVRIIEAACKRSGWPQEKFFLNIAEYANTSAASIPIALDEMLSRGLLKKGQLVLTVGFGSGLTYGGNLLRY